jgi:hypothetical protein
MKIKQLLDEAKKGVKAPKHTVKPRNFVAKNAIATTSGAGAHKDKKKAEKQGDVKHKKKEHELAESASSYYYEKLADELFALNPNLDTSGRADEVLNAAFPLIVRDLGSKKRANNLLNYDQDFPSDFVSAYGELQRANKTKMVQDRKTGKMYDPDVEFDKLKNSDDFQAQMKRMAQKEGVTEGSAHGYNVVKWYKKSGGDQLKLTRWLRKEAGLPNDDDIYFDDADLVYGDKTIVRDALVDPNLKFIDLLNAVAQATGGSAKQKVQGVYREQGVAEEKQKGVDGKACWDGYKRMGTKKKGGKTVDNCVPMNESFDPEYDDEAGMADNNLETLKRAVEGLDDMINEGDNLPEWCQEKIAVAKSMLVSVWDYMQSEENSMSENQSNPDLMSQTDYDQYQQGQMDQQKRDFKRDEMEQELGHEERGMYYVIIAKNGKWEHTKAQPRQEGMNAAERVISALHSKYPNMHLGMVGPDGKVYNYGKGR